MKELGKVNLKIVKNIIINKIFKIVKCYKKWIRKPTSFTINNSLSFIDIFHFLSSSLGRLVKSLSKDDFKYLSQELDNNILDPQPVTKYLRPTLVFT